MGDPPKIKVDTTVGAMPVNEDDTPRIVSNNNGAQTNNNNNNNNSNNTQQSREEYEKEAQEHLQQCESKGTDDPTLTRSQDELNCLIDPSNIYVLQQFGGIEGLAKALNTNLQTGLNSNDNHDARRQAYGENKLPERKSKSLLTLIWIAMKDKVLIILGIAALISFALGMYETFGQPPKRDAEGRKLPKVDWVEGVAILVAVTIVVMVGALNDWQKERQFVKLNKKKEDRVVKVVRNEKPVEISVYDVMVGDLLMAEPGDMLPADGVLVHSYDVKCDESSATGESDTLKKKQANVALKMLDDKVYEPSSKKVDPFMLSGGKVTGGTGTFLVTAVGPNSLYGRTMMSLGAEEQEATPLQDKLNTIAEGIAKVGLAAALILFIALFIRFCVKLKGSHQTPAQKGNEFLDIFITAVTIVVVAVPEGLPLAVTLALAYATTKMVKDNNLVRVLKSCETMGGATTVCSDKTGTLTQNKMSVVAGTVGKDASFEVKHDEEIVEGNEPAEVLSNMDDRKRELLLDSIALNSSAFESNDPDDPDRFVGSKTETALLNFASRFLALENLDGYRNKHDMTQVYPFDSAKKFMSTVIPRGEGYQVLVKGASEVVLSKCRYIYDANTQREREITEKDTESLRATIDNYASRSLRTIGIVYRNIDKVPQHADPADRERELFHDFTFLSVVGIMDPLRPGVRQAVEDCRTAGVVVRMVTGDNIHTAKAIALDCGILTGPDDDGIVMEGPKFRKLDMFEMKRVVPKLRVLARSSPEDKRKLVKILKSQGETVAVTGDGTNDAPALKLADVGFSMGIAGTEVAKEASEIILMDDNFGSIVKAIMWGRAVNDAVKKFLQFQLTVNVTAVLLTFVSAVASSKNKSVLTAVQLLWVNLIMDSFAALALATDPPSPSILERTPDNRKTGLITVGMWKMIFGQAILQLVVTFVLHFAGYKLFHADTAGSRKHTEVDAMVFNTFVWLQFFNIFVNRRLDNKLNILEGVFKNRFFLAIVFIIGGGQVLIMFVGGAAFSTRRQTGPEWAVALICGLLSIPASFVIRKVPDSFVLKLWPSRLIRFVVRHTPFVKPKPNINIVEDEENGPVSRGVDPSQYKWNPAIEQVRDQLVFLKKFKGGRLSNLRFKPRQMFDSWKETLSPGSSSAPSSIHESSSAHSPTTLTPNSPHYASGNHTPPPQPAESGGFLAVPGSNSSPKQVPRSRGNSTGSSTIGALTMVPGIVGGAIGGWNPVQSQPSSPSSQQVEAAVDSTENNQPQPILQLPEDDHHDADGERTDDEQHR